MSKEIRARAGIHRDVTVCSDGSDLIWKGRQEIGYQNSAKSSRTQAERKKSITNIVKFIF